MIINKIRNKADGITAEISKLDDGKYSVVLLDDDSGERLDIIYIFDSLEKAVSKVDEILN